MKHILFIFTFLLLSSMSHAKIYKWIDENGSVHFSDKPYSQNAKEVNVQGTGISIQRSEEEFKAEKARKEKQQEENNQRANPVTKPDAIKEEKDGVKTITEADYRISSGVGKLGGDIISISGRISSGPRCNDMTVTATATNDNGLSGTIIDNVSKTNSYGSTVFEGNAKVSGSADDYGFWEVKTVTIRCNDAQ